MRVLSLFDGLGGARQALKELDVCPARYIASELDKYAIKVAQTNYPDIIHIGDINDINNEIDKLYGPFDLIIGGSPCQDLSIAKSNRKGLSGSCSGLFWKMAMLIEYFKPKYFLVENVASMSKENKQIITNVLGVEPIMINGALLTAQSRKRLYWTNIKGVTQPEDKGVLLKDILETGYTERYKSLCVTASYKKDPLKDYFLKGRRQVVFNKPVKLSKGKESQSKRIYSIEGKSITLSANGGGQGAKTGLYLLSKNDIRMLTPVECERLQGLPDNYTEGVSNTQRYKMIGNGFTIPVIKHILSFMEM